MTNPLLIIKYPSIEELIVNSNCSFTEDQLADINNFVEQKLEDIKEDIKEEVLNKIRSSI